MQTRILVAAIAVPLIVLLIFFAPLWAFSIFIGVVSAISAWEFLRCVSPNAHVRFRLYAAVSAFVIPVSGAVRPDGFFLSPIVFILALLMFCEVIVSFREKEPLKLETVFYVAFAGSIMPLMLSAMVRIGLRESSSVYLLLPFIAAFTSDSGGYFAGKFFGKHKAFPHLSPNKTVEGCIGGFIAATGFMLLYGFVLTRFGFSVNYPTLALYGLLGSLACQLGDLAFSAVKRQYGIKDYGTLIPGHGGALDRFDSMHFTAPMIEILVLLLPAITK